MLATIVKLASKAVCTAFVIRNENYYTDLNVRVNTALPLRLNASYINLAFTLKEYLPQSCFNLSLIYTLVSDL